MAQGAFIYPYIADIGDDESLLIGVYGGAALLSFGERQLQVTLGAHAYGVTVSEQDTRYDAAPVTPGNLQVHWPEGNVLIRRGRRSPGRCPRCARPCG